MRITIRRHLIKTCTHCRRFHRIISWLQTVCSFKAVVSSERFCFHQKSNLCGLREQPDLKWYTNGSRHWSSTQGTTKNTAYSEKSHIVQRCRSSASLESTSRSPASGEMVTLMPCSYLTATTSASSSSSSSSTRGGGCGLIDKMIEPKVIISRKCNMAMRWWTAATPWRCDICVGPRAC